MSTDVRTALLALLLALVPACIKKRDAEDEPTKDDTKILESLSYLDNVYDAEPEDKVADRIGRVGKKNQAFEGLNFYTSRLQLKAELVDMDGVVLHRWASAERNMHWQHAHLYPGTGDVLALVKDTRLLRVAVDSSEYWRYEARVHHDCDVHPNGDIYVLAREAHFARYHESMKTIIDYILILSDDGVLKDQIVLTDILANGPYGYLIEQPESPYAITDFRANDRAVAHEYDALHPNHVEVMDGSAARYGKLWGQGNILVTLRNVNAALILDGETHHILWLWGPNNLIFPHHSSALDNGNILTFNNGRKRVGSTIVELDPRTNRIVWTYNNKKKFFSFARGSAQRLPNGNTLITESDKGFVFEVTRRGKKVWEFANPHKDGENRLPIWRMVRYPREALTFPFNGGHVIPPPAPESH